MKRVATFMLLASVCFGADGAGRWTLVKDGAWEPDALALSQLQADIQGYVSAEAARNGTKLSPWAEYGFQFQGQSERNKRVIVVNAFCYLFGDERLEDNFVDVFDGGPCFFKLVYEPEKRRFHGLRFNGHA